LPCSMRGCIWKGELSELFGRKTFYIGCVIVFTASSFLCGIAPSLPVLVALRALQGASGGGLQPIFQAILMETLAARPSSQDQKTGRRDAQADPAAASVAYDDLNDHSTFGF
jgi:MFS family permease